MEVIAEAKYLRTSPRKLMLVAAKMEKLKPSQALVSLKFTPKAAAADLSKAIKSALANAVNNHKLAESKLVIKKIEVLEGPRLKRQIPRSRGMAHPILKRTSHLKVILEEEK
ncbi:MAG: 50S ribosomal protein L22 [Patescibacteria group bacterium]|nr:50S ribosomal protein L22 [Patescibacteria group bacterium]